MRLRLRNSKPQSQSKSLHAISYDQQRTSNKGLKMLTRLEVYPSLEEFKKIAERGKRVPVYAVLPVDQSPLDAAAKLGLAHVPNGFLLESLNGSPKIAQYSLLGIDPFLVFKSRGDLISLTEGRKVHVFNGNPFEELRRVMSKNASITFNELPLFVGGIVGFFSYDFAHWFERLPMTTFDDTKTPDCYFMFFDLVVVFDHQKGQLFVIYSAAPDDDPDACYKQARDKVRESVSRLRSTQDWREPGFFQADEPQANLEKGEFQSMVKKAMEYIFAGDIYQVNLSLRLESDFKGDPFSLYQVLRKINPSPFAGYLNFSDMQIVSSSPERLIRLEKELVETRPIAGTRRRGADLSEDSELTADLILDPKERAEHIMLVDLERNDIGRVCRYGSVLPDELMVMEYYSHVIHIVSNVCGELKTGNDYFDVIKACFPGGTITGCPKIRSMEVIDELEPVRRGIYTGSMGYLSFSGDMDLNIIIRTILIKDGKAYAQAGAGIVADSVPEREYYESLQKAQALLAALKGQGSSSK